MDVVQYTENLLNTFLPGHQCKVSRAPEGQGSGFPWVWAVALALVCSYSIIVTIVACVTWVRYIPQTHTN